MSIFEITMLLCFGAAWPTSIYKTIKSKSTEGKSFYFLIIAIVGYISGILNKIFYTFDYVIILYAINLIMISIDAMLYMKYSKFNSIK